jgi:hypothetical protein
MMEKEFEIVRTVYNSNEEVITNIMNLYGIERFDLDCTYSKGKFWKGLPDPTHKTDLIPHFDNVKQADSEDLPFEDSSLNSIMYDPPFIIMGRGKKYKHDLNENNSKMAKRFEGYGTYNDLTSNYYNTLKELYRICDKGGFVVMKCQDTVSGGKQYFSHVHVMNMALNVGFYPKDLFVLTSNVRMNSFNGTKWKKQHHARKYHSYFWVFQKVKPKFNYEFE